MSLLSGASAAPAPPAPYRAREWEILVAATWNGEPQRPWEQLPESPGKQLFQGVVERLLSDREAAVLPALYGAAADLGLDVRLGRDPAFDEQMRGFLCAALTYVRNLDRIAVVRALADAGLPLTICGEGWDALLGARPNVRHLGRAPFDALAMLYRNARVVVNLNAGNGACERALYAALAGAAVVSDRSRPLEELFGADAVGLFHRAAPITAVEAADRLLAGEGEAIAARGQARVERLGTWRARAQQLVDFLSDA